MHQLKSPSDILLLLKAGSLKEHLHTNLELKEDWQQNHGQKISALANKIKNFVSFLAVGITDQGALVGKDEKWVKQTEEIISQHTNLNLDPVQSCSGIECHDTGSGWIIIVTIKNVGEVVYWGSAAYVASGTTIKQMEAEAILQLRMQLPGLTDFSNQSIRSSYDAKLVVEFAENVKAAGHLLEIEWRGSREYSVLHYLGLHERQAARILFGKCPYRVVEYGANGDVTSNKTHLGLYQLLSSQSINDLAKHNGCNYSPKALKEALANAVAHAAYFERDGDIIIEVYPDHVTISNLCLRESALFANRWFSRAHKTVNNLLMEALRIARAVDELGRGKNIIFSESIKLGTKAPEVVIETAGKYRRWKLIMFGGHHDPKLLRLLNRSREIYRDERKALIAQALVLWSSKPVKEIRSYVDDEFAKLFGEVLEGYEGPIFHDSKDDRIILARWARILLGEGKDSKVLSPAEDERLFERLHHYCTQHEGGYVTPKLIREFSWMGNTKSEQVLSSTMLKGWHTKGRVEKAGHGKFRFKEKPKPQSPSVGFLELFTSDGPDTKTP